MQHSDFEHWLGEAPRRPLVMGILNATPDSFSDGGRFLAVDRAVEHGRQMVLEGADMIDIGGESTRPGAKPVSDAEQIRRVVPVIESLARAVQVLISVDTTSAAVARAAIDAGAGMINDVSAGRDDPAMFKLAAQSAVPIVLMHRQGDSKSMQANPHYENVVREVYQFLDQRRTAAIRAGVEPHRILLDVGIGFGKTIKHNQQLLTHHRQFAKLDQPILLGTSRKRFIGEVTGVAEPDQRLSGTLATTAWGILNGADIVRVHDVKANVEVVRMIRFMQDQPE